MLRLSRKVEYGLMALLHMADLPSDKWVSAKELAEQHQIPADLLGKVLQALSRANITEATLGARGGYRLQQPLDELTLRDVLEAVEGPVRLVKCQDNPDCCDHYPKCSIRRPIHDIQQQLTDYMGAFRLGQFKRKHE